MKKVYFLFLFPVCLFSFSINLHSQAINPAMIAQNVVSALRDNSFNKYYSLHAANILNTPYVLDDLKRHLKLKGLPIQTVNHLTTRMKKNFAAHHIRFRKKIWREFQDIRKTLYSDWNKVNVFSAGIDSLHQKNGLLRCNIKIYINVKNEFKILLLNGAIITSKGKIFICDELSPIKSLFKFKNQEVFTGSTGAQSGLREELERRLQAQNRNSAAPASQPDRQQSTEQENVIDPEQTGNRANGEDIN